MANVQRNLPKESRFGSLGVMIVQYIKKHRFELKTTADECRKILGVNKSTLTKWEQRRHKPSLLNCEKISRVEAEPQF